MSLLQYSSSDFLWYTLMEPSLRSSVDLKSQIRHFKWNKTYEGDCYSIWLYSIFCFSSWSRNDMKIRSGNAYFYFSVEIWIGEEHIFFGVSKLLSISKPFQLSLTLSISFRYTHSLSLSLSLHTLFFSFFLIISLSLTHTHAYTHTHT